MAFQTKKSYNKPTAPQKKETTPAKPDYILKVKLEEGATDENGKPIKYQRIGAGWTTEQGGIKITFDADIELKSTEADRAKALLFPNTMPKK